MCDKYTEYFIRHVECVGAATNTTFPLVDYNNNVNDNNDSLYEFIRQKATYLKLQNSLEITAQNPKEIYI